MSDALQLILEDEDGTQLETSCTRFAVLWQGKEVWIQQDGRGQIDRVKGQLHPAKDTAGVLTGGLSFPAHWISFLRLQIHFCGLARVTRTQLRLDSLRLRFQSVLLNRIRY